MSRRTVQLFNLSLLDLLTGALGAIIFLFIITPKGGHSPTPTQQAVVYFDSIQMKLYGSLPDSLLSKQPGDTLLTVLVDYKALPKNPSQVKSREEKKSSVVLAKNNPQQLPTKPIVKKQPEPTSSTPPRSKDPVQPKKEEKTTTTKEKPETPTTQSASKFKGSPPVVPCKVSFEISWLDKEDNIDLFVCKDGSCVYGARKKDKKIGQWDSGKSRNRLFGNDLRTNQEAVRQFDHILPGEYQIYAQFKESKKNSKSVLIKGLIYTKDKANQERGESFSKQLTLGKERILIGTVILKENGLFQFKKKA